MAADGFLNFDTRINTGGFETDTQKIAKALGGMKDKLKKLGAMLTTVFGARALANFAKEAKEAWQVQSEAETKIATILGRNLGASEEQIKAVKEWASELQKVGVIGDEVQLSGLQELSTYIESADSLRTMNVVLNDMLAQQYGLNATAEEAVTISTMLGKVLEGQTSALSRYGYSFTEAQEQLLKFGTEEQRVATLAEVVEASVGGMNEALANTPLGRLKQVSNTLGDIKEQFGKAFTNISALFVPALEKMAALLERIADLAVKVSEQLADIFGVELKEVEGIGGGISESVDSQEELTTAVEETEENQKKSLETEENSLANFDRINTVATKTAAETEPEKKADDKAETAPVRVVPKVSDNDVKDAADTLSDKLSALIKPVQLAWEDNSPALIESAQRAAETVRGLFSSVGDSIEKVWTNGTGERFIGNILTLFSDVLGIIGDISLALKNAWDDGGRGTAVVQSIADRWNSLLELIHAVSQSFRDAWNDGAGEKIFANILDIIRNINGIWTNLRTQFTEAWTENERGTRIFSVILGIANTILGTVKRITGATAEWAKSLDFAPVLDSIGGLLEAIKPLTDNIGDALAWLYENVLLPLGKWTIEKAVPVSIDLLSAAIKLLNSVITTLKPMAEFLIEEFLKPIAAWTGGVITDVLDGISDALSEVADWIKQNQTLAEDIVIVIGSVVAAIGVFNGTNAIVGAIGNLKMLLTQLIWSTTELLANAVAWVTANAAMMATVGIIAAVIAAGVLLIKHWDEVKAFAIGVWNEIQARLWDFFDNVNAIFTGISDFLSGIWNGIKKTFSDVGTWFKAQFSKAWNNIKTAWSGAVKWFTDVWNSIQKAFSVAADWFRELFSNAWENVRNAWSNAVKWFGDVWNGITNIFSAVGSWFGDRFREAWDSITGIFSGIHGFFSDRLRDIHNIFGGIGDWFEERFRNAWDRVKNVFAGVRDFFSGIWSDVSNGAKDGINWVIDKLNNLLWRLQDGINNIVNSINSALSIHIPDNVPVIGGTSFELGLPNVRIPQIPYLAQGTYVPANYGNFLAVLGDNKREPEIVSPVSSMKTALREVIREQGGNDKPITVVCVLDGREIGRVAVNAVNRDRALKGG